MVSSIRPDLKRIRERGFEKGFRIGHDVYKPLEHLVAGVIISVIIGVVAYTTVPKIQESGKRIKCLQNLRQIGIALQMYQEDYDGLMPRTTDLSKPVGNYITSGNALSFFICPSDQREPKKSEREQHGSYYSNDKLLSNKLQDIISNEPLVWDIDGGAGNKKVTNHKEGGNVVYSYQNAVFLRYEKWKKVNYPGR